MNNPVPTTTEERLSRLEAACEHLATKADIAELKAEIKTDIGGLKTGLAEFKGSLRLLMLLIGAGLTLLNIVLRLWT